MRLTVAGPIRIAAAFGIAIFASAARAQVTVSGVGYANYAYQLNSDTTLTPAANLNNFDVTRAYITVAGKFADGIGTRITADIDGRKAAGNQQTFRLKYAYVTWQPNGVGPLTYKIGLMHTPWLDWEEALNEHRFQGTMPMERNGYLSSSDFGVGVDGMWKYDRLNVQLGHYNGENYNNAPGDNRKDFEGRFSWRLAKSDLAGRLGGLRLAGYAQVGTATGGGTRQRVIGMLSYKSKNLTLAGQIGITEDSTGTKTPNQKGRVLAAYGVYYIPNSKIGLLGRLDIFDPNTDSTSVTLNVAGNTATNKQTRLIAGMSYTMNPNFRFLVDVDLDALENGASNVFDKTRQTLYFHTQFTF